MVGDANEKDGRRGKQQRYCGRRVRKNWWRNIDKGVKK